MAVPRFFRLAVVAGLVASLALSGVAVAADRSTSVLNVWGTMGVFGTHTNFFARWQVTSTTQGGVTVWLIDDFDMDALVINGKDCPPIICADWAFGVKVDFLNSANAVVGTTTLPAGSCYASAISPRSRLFSRCRSTQFGLVASASKVRMSWTVSVQRADGIWLQAWKASKTVALS
jgi:hypothetical protein